MQEFSVVDEAISNNDIEMLKEIVGNLCYACRDFSDGKFDEAIRYIKANGIELKEAYNAKEPLVSEGKSELTDDDFSEAVYRLKNNFCDERIRDVKKIGKALYGVEIKVIETKATKERKKASSGTEGTVPNQTSHQKDIVVPAAITLVAVILIVVILVVK